MHACPHCGQPVQLPLSVREQKIVDLLGVGASIKEIASMLYVSVKTIDSHLRHVRDKLDLSPHGLRVYAIREQLKKEMAGGEGCGDYASGGSTGG